MPALPHAVWRKSTRSDQEGQCVEVASLGATVGIRDSKDITGPVLRFGRRSMAQLAAEVRAGNLDLT